MNIFMYSWQPLAFCQSYLFEYVVVVALLCISLMIHSVEHCFMCLLAICIFSLEKCLFIFSTHFSLELTFCQVLRVLSRWCNGKESTCQCRRHKRHRVDPWVGKIPWSRKWQQDSSMLAWKVPLTEEPNGLQFMGSQRVGHDGAHVCCTALQEVSMYSEH